jgi:hypothetical protein
MAKRVLGPGATCCGENCGTCAPEPTKPIEVPVVVEDELDEWDDEDES